MPQRRLRRLRFGGGGRGGRGGLGSRSRQRPEILLGQVVADVERQKLLAASPERPLHQQLEAPGPGDVQRGADRRLEQVHVVQAGGAGRRDVGDAPVVEVAEPDAGVALQHLDAVEHPAAHVARPFERVEAVGGDQDRLLSGLEALLERVVAGVAEQAAADRRHADRRDVEVDERVAGVGRFGMVRPFLVP